MGGEGEDLEREALLALGPLQRRAPPRIRLYVCVDHTRCRVLRGCYLHACID